MPLFYGSVAEGLAHLEVGDITDDYDAGRYAAALKRAKAEDEDDGTS